MSSSLSSFLGLLRNSLVTIESSLVWFSIDLATISSILGLRSRSDIKFLSLAIYDLLRTLSTDRHTFIIPSFTYTFGLSNVFNPFLEVPTISSFSRFLFSCGVTRSSNPIYSFFVIGRDTDLLNNHLYNCVGNNSPFFLLHQKNCSIFSCGHHFASTLSSIHQLEYDLDVSYRYIKYLKGFIFLSNYEKLYISSRFYARDTTICDFSSITHSGVNMLFEHNFIRYHFFSINRGMLSYSLELSKVMGFLYGTHSHTKIVDAFHSESPLACDTFLTRDSRLFYNKDLLLFR